MKNKYLKYSLFVLPFFAGIFLVIGINFFTTHSNTSGQVLSASTSKESVNQNLKTEVRLGNSIIKPNAFQIKLIYDPSLITVQKIEDGNMWKSTNILTSKIDNKNGILKYAAGIAFGSNDTPNTTLFIINYTSKNGPGKFTIAPESKFGYLSTTSLLPINENYIQFVLK